MFNKNLAIKLALLTAVVSGVSNFWNKSAVTAAGNAVAFTTMKNLVVTLLLIGLILTIGRWREVLALDRRGWLSLVAVGVIGGSLPFALFFTGLSQTAAVNAAIIHKTLFVWVAIMAVPLLKERLSAWQWTGAAAVFGANLIIGGFQGFRWNAAELMILAATLLWATENIIAKRALRHISAMTLAAARLTIGSIVLVPFLAWRGGFAVVSGWGATQWGWVLLTAGFLLAYVLCWYSALKLAPVTLVAALLLPATLITNALTAVFVTHQLSSQQLASGLLFILGTILLISTGRRSLPAPTVAATKV